MLSLVIYPALEKGSKATSLLRTSTRGLILYKKALLYQRDVIIKIKITAVRLARTRQSLYFSLVYLFIFIFSSFLSDREKETDPKKKPVSPFF